MTGRAIELLNHICGTASILLTPSCTHALELACRLVGLQPGDEVIIPSFNFPSAATAVTLCGATPVFVDVDLATKNISATAFAKEITERTRAVIVLHYAGVSADIMRIADVARSAGLAIIEDVAHGLGVRTDGPILGSVGDFATYSFHETKNVQCGEGGALQINDLSFMDRAEVLRDKGTNRKQFHRGLVDKYSWVDIGSSWLLADPLAAVLCGQLEMYGEIQRQRRATWTSYFDGLSGHSLPAGFMLPHSPVDQENAAHMFYLIAPSLEARSRFIEHLSSRGVSSAFHYQPLHSSIAGKRFGRTGDCSNSIELGDRLVRLPLYAGMLEDDLSTVLEAVYSFEA
jgi:dTDP-4-amino-4,6-dideoxygalactose transaminase